MAGGGSYWVAVLVGFFVLVVLNHFLPLLFKAGIVPKGAFGWPLLGETLGFLKPHSSNSVGAFLQDHCSRYGKVFKSHLFFSPTVVSCDPELNYFILQNEGKLFECSYPKPIHGILDKVSMLVAVGDTHRRLRKAALSLVTITKSKPEFINDIERISLQILDSWRNKPKVIFCEEARKFTFNVIVKQVLGLTPQEPETSKILQDFLTFMKGLISLPLYIPGTPYARAVKARSRISSTVKAIIEKRRRSRRNNDDGNSKKSSDFLEILLSVDTFSEDEKVSFVLDSLLGGYETTSLLMSMVVHFLSHTPAALQQLKVTPPLISRIFHSVAFIEIAQEHHNIRSMKQKHDHLDWEDYKKMNFTQKVSYLIPSGWKVLTVFTAVHLDPSLHANALQFHPWRWKSQDPTCKKFTPFGGGSRCCPGSDLAKVEVAFFLHHLVQNFRWKTDDEDQPIAYPYVEFQRGLVLNIDPCSETTM
ncbi:CYP724B1 protein [Hibiscus syriacus]|uniref:CYP724B1 protein n=1 Tax=Hibiscus syriacus TaxID=106335 RepID=A0A6A2ZU23_HIBSY|nr:CYP724B1 protein [Hibiscus syriacus]